MCGSHKQTWPRLCPLCFRRLVQLRRLYCQGCPESTSTGLVTAAETGLRQDEQSHQQWLTRRSTGTLGFSLPVCCSFCLSLRYLFTCIMIGHCRLTHSPAATQQHGEGSTLADNFTLATYVTSGAVGGGTMLQPSWGWQPGSRAGAAARHSPSWHSGPSACPSHASCQSLTPWHWQTAQGSDHLAASSSSQRLPSQEAMTAWASSDWAVTLQEGKS